MEKLKLTQTVFNQLFDDLRRKYEDNIQKNGLEKATGVGAAMFGFREFSESENSIKGIMLLDIKIRDYIKNYFKIKDKEIKTHKKQLKRDLINEKLNGKYLYDRLREAQKGKTIIQLTGLHAKLYFIYLGYDSLEQFLENADVHSEEVERQLSLNEGIYKYISDFATKFVAYYFSYRENKIKKFILEIDHINEMRVRQTGFHFVLDDTSQNASPSTFSYSIEYKGHAIDRSNYLYIYLQGDKEEGNFMNIFLYQGGMQIQNMNLVRGTLTAMSAHGYIFSGEIFLRRIEDLKTTVRELLLKEDLSPETNSIKRYLFLERRTFRIPRNTEQNINQISAKRYSLKAIESMIGIWKIWGVDYKNRIMQSKLIINHDYSTYLYTHSDVRDERQVCILRISEGINGLNLWISAHQQFGIELKNIASVKVPFQTEQFIDITSGISCGLGVRQDRYASTPIVLYKIAKDDFHPKRLGEGEVRQFLFSHPNRHKYIILYKKLEQAIKELPTEEDKFIPYQELSKNISDASKNSSLE